MDNILPDSEYDISKENFGSEYRQAKTKPSKSECNVSKPGRSRSMRLKSKAFDTCFLNLSDCKNTIESESAGNFETEKLNNGEDMNISDNSNTIKTDNDITRAKNRKHSSQEWEDLIDSINVDDIAALLLDTDINIRKELESPNISKRQKSNIEQPEKLVNNSPSKSGEYVKETERNSHVLQSEYCNMRLEKDIDISEAIIEEVENGKQSFLRNTRSFEMANNVSNDKTLQTNEINKKVIECSNVLQSSVQTQRKRGRGRPPLPVKRISKQPKIKKYTKISKLTKEQIKNAGTRKIPKDRLDDVLNMIDNDDHPIWDDRNTSCNPYIFNHWNPRTLNSDQNIKIKYARQFLLRRDWISLSKILGLFTPKAKIYYPLLIKYAALLFAHTDKDEFNKLIQYSTKFNDGSAVLKTCTKMTVRNTE